MLLSTSKTDITVAVHANYARQPGGETRARDIAYENLINMTRKPGRQDLQTLVPNPVLRDMTGSANLAIVENAPLDTGVSDIK
jgi:hypothetical protein